MSIDEVSAAAQRLYREAAAADPDVRLDEAAFVARILQTVECADDRLAALATVHARDLFVAHAAVLGDGTAIVQLDRRLREQAAAVARSLGESRGFAEDLQSDLREHVLAPRDGGDPRLSGYAGLGPLDGWLRVTVAREAVRVRKQAARRGDSEDLLELPGVVAPELEFLKASYREHFRTAFRSAIRGLDDRQQNLIKLHYSDGLGIERLGQMYRVHFSTISRWISAARQKLFDDTRAIVRAQFGVDDREFAEIMDLVRSRLDVTISLFIRADS